MIVPLGHKVQSQAPLSQKDHPTLIAIGARAIPPVSGISTFVEVEDSLHAIRRTSGKGPEKEAK